MSEIIKPGIYKHFKGKDYKIFCEGKEFFSKEKFVIYLPLYKFQEYDENQLWIRPKDNFLAPKILDNKEIEKFKLYEELNLNERNIKKLNLNFPEIYLNQNKEIFDIYNRAIHSETLEKVIIYKILNPNEDNNKSDLLIQNEEEFFKNNLTKYKCNIKEDDNNYILNGLIVPGRGSATKTISLQSKFFEKEGVDKKYFSKGSINVFISPYIWELKEADYEFKNIDWFGDGVCEDFKMVNIELDFKGKKQYAIFYNPCKTKNPRTVIEVLAEHIPNLNYGDNINLKIPKNKIELKK